MRALAHFLQFQGGGAVVNGRAGIAQVNRHFVTVFKEA